MAKITLDSYLVENKLFNSRSTAVKTIRLNLIKVNGRVVNEPKTLINTSDKVEKVTSKSYVSRGGYKLEAANKVFKLNFKKASVLDVGSSSGGFSDYSLTNHAKKVFAVELGSNQMDARLRSNPKLELHEKTDIRQVLSNSSVGSDVKLGFTPDIVLIDLSFVSLRFILPHIYNLINAKSFVIALAKPQFEAKNMEMNKGIIKNQKIRRQILKDFENWLKNNRFIILGKVDSEVPGLKGNIERFYLLKTR